MRRPLPTSMLLLGLAGAGCGADEPLGSTGASRGDASSRPPRYVVGLAGAPEPVRNAAAGRLVRRLRRAVVLEVDAPLAEVRLRLRGRGEVRWIEPEVWLRVAPRAVPDDPLYPEQWNLHPSADPEIAPQTAIGVEAAWDVSRGLDPSGEPVRVAVIDDGFDLGHPELSFGAGADFAAAAGPPGWDDDPSFGPGDLHGTQTAGVIAARGFDGSGVSGVCPACELVPVRLIGGGGPPDLYVSGSAAAAAIEFAAFTAGAAVINNSWGPPDGNPFAPGHEVELYPEADGGRPAGELPRVLVEALHAAATEGRDGLGAVITWAAGNGNELMTYDAFAADPSVLAVGSVDATGRKAYYSDFGPPLFLVAPSSGLGGRPAVWTTDVRGAAGEDPGDFTSSYGGTSAAAAEVAGVAALLLAARPQLRAAQVAEAMALAAFPIDERYGAYRDGRSQLYGYGRVDAGAALARAALYTDDCTLGLERCDGRDDDCDGEVDEGCAPRCVPNAGNERCDADDNDCDGALNEDFVCVASDRPTCAACTATTQCRADARCSATPDEPGTFCLQECAAPTDCTAEFTCATGVCRLAGDEPPAPATCADYLVCAEPESCDGRDQDCDGVIDDVDLDGSEANAARAACRELGCSDAGAECHGGAWRCTLPPEACFDGVDNDCDGRVDEGCPLRRGCRSASNGAPALGAVLLALALRHLRRRSAARNVRLHAH